MGGGGDDELNAGQRSPGDEEATLQIQCSSGSKFSVRANLDITVGSFKSVVAQNCDTPAEQQCLIYRGRILKDDQTLQSYGLEADHTIHMVRGFAQAASATSEGTLNPADNALPNLARDLGSDESRVSDFGNSLFPGIDFNMFASGGLFETILSQLEEAIYLAQNTNMIREFINLPGIQNLFDNPDFMNNLIVNNPLLQQVIGRNPEIAHILNDPSILRQTFESIRNPEFLREIMRNTDGANNIIFSSEEFNVLRSVYENVQEPPRNAVMTAGNTENRLDPNPLAALLGRQGGGQSVDESTNRPNSSSEVAGSPPPNADPLPNPWGSTGTTEDSRGTNPAGDSRQPTPDGLGGLGLPQIGRLSGTVPDSTSQNQLMQNIASLISNPQLISQQSLVSQLGQQQASQERSQSEGGTTGMRNGAGLMNILGLVAGTLARSRRSDVPPEQLYATQLLQLQEMGFIDTRENIQALIATSGNVHAAVDRILGSLGS